MDCSVENKDCGLENETFFSFAFVTFFSFTDLIFINLIVYNIVAGYFDMGKTDRIII